MSRPQRDSSHGLTLDYLASQLADMKRQHGPDAKVRLIVNGTAHPVEDVWWEAHQERDGAVCMGEDPR